MLSIFIVLFVSINVAEIKTCKKQTIKNKCILNVYMESPGIPLASRKMYVSTTRRLAISYKTNFCSKQEVVCIYCIMALRIDEVSVYFCILFFLQSQQMKMANVITLESQFRINRLSGFWSYK